MVFHSNNEAESSPSKGKVRFHWLIDGDTKGWVHTHGMGEFGLPELEIRDCSAFLAESAVHLMCAGVRPHAHDRSGCPGR